MLSSAKHQRKHRVSAPNKNKILNKVPSISSSSSPSHSQVQKRSLITMEEVWKDINLASIHHLNHHSQHPQHNHEPRFRSHNHQNQNPNSIFQDFLNRPLNLEPTIPTSLSGDATTGTALFGSSPLAPPATVLSLNSSACFEFLDNQDPLVTSNSNLHSHNHLTNVRSAGTPFEALVTSTCFGKKRGQESNEGSGNRHHKRMIKNRESAARSRARKQEYELELKVAHLKAENARLKRQQDQLKMAAANQQPKKNTLQRSSSALF
ncbi:BnaC03g76870D [Brassica napus]|uniref:(rape) hypothetical protein n=1 Tax=Brassica napus TaxID=3708 RepID=A0A078J6E7_BRANA|nr:unnamed protein product [Brassica napus]CDY62049.1 BnaC03g76870D [Brassica napus]